MYVGPRTRAHHMVERKLVRISVKYKKCSILFLFQGKLLIHGTSKKNTSYTPNSTLTDAQNNSGLEIFLYLPPNAYRSLMSPAKGAAVVTWLFGGGRFEQGKVARHFGV